MLIDSVIPDEGIIGHSGLTGEASLWQAGMVDSAVHLFKADMIEVSETTTLAELLAAEADYQGYDPDGLPIAAFNNPVDDPAGGCVVYSPLIQFDYVDAAPHTANEIAGYYLLDASNHIMAIVEFPETITFASNDDGVAIVVAKRFANPTP